jgi:prophage maintenance system killer protein
VDLFLQQAARMSRRHPADVAHSWGPAAIARSTNLPVGTVSRMLPEVAGDSRSRRLAAKRRKRRLQDRSRVVLEEVRAAFDEIRLTALDGAYFAQMEVVSDLVRHLHGTVEQMAEKPEAQEDTEWARQLDVVTRALDQVGRNLTTDRGHLIGAIEGVGPLLPLPEEQPQFLIDLVNFNVGAGGDGSVVKWRPLERLRAGLRKRVRGPGGPDAADKAAALLLGVVRDEPFRSHNRATAMLAAATFLESQGHVVRATDDELIDLVLSAGDPATTSRTLAEALRRFSGGVTGLEPAPAEASELRPNPAG